MASDATGLTPSARGAAWMLLAGVLFAVMGSFVKHGAQHFSGAELVFYRSLFGFATIFAMVRLRGLPLATPLWKAHLWRGLSGFIALLLFFYALSGLPLATAITLNYTSPLFLALLTTVALRERARPAILFAVALGFVGVVLLLRPTITPEQLLIGVGGLISGFFAAIAYLNVRHLGRQGEPEWRIVFYFTLFSSAGGAAWMLANTFHPVSGYDLAMLIGMGATATLAQLAMTRAYREGDTLTVGSFAYSTVVFASLLGYLLWNETLPAESWGGVAVIVLSGVISVRFTPRG